MRFLFVNDENEIFVHNGAKFEIKTISEANLVDNIDLIVAIKFNGKLLGFYHSHSEAVMEFKYQNKAELEDCLYDIAKSEIKSKFFEMVIVK